MAVRVKRGIVPDDPRQWKPPQPRRPLLAGLGRLRKIAMLGGCATIQYAPWHDPTWELWAHASCRHLCKREPDLLFDLHPPALWKDPKKKWWDTSYYKWLQQAHVPIMMQEHYPDIPASIKYPFGRIITEFPRGYMTNTIAYMVALALQEGVTHIGIYGADYTGAAEYIAQRGCCEYWLGVAEGRGVQILLPPTCDLLNRPEKLYGYESHEGGKRDPSYALSIPGDLITKGSDGKPKPVHLCHDPNDPAYPPLRNIGVPPALDRRTSLPMYDVVKAFTAKE